MKFGVSSYCFWQEIGAGRMDIVGAVAKAKEIGAEHIEIVPLGFDLIERPELIQAIKDKAAEVGIALSNYAIGANFAGLDDEACAMEIARVKRHVDIAAALGIKLMRHDVANSQDTSIKQYMKDLPRLAEACRQVADYAAERGITTSVENHGYYTQASERVQALIHAVDRENFRTTLDVGNFLCVDENPVVAVARNAPYASMVHMKDFYVRPAALNPGEGWFRSAGGYYLRGAIVGQGDIDIRAVIAAVRASGYEGYVSIEFEGMEPCIQATKIALDNVKRLWQEAN